MHLHLRNMADDTLSLKSFSSLEENFYTRIRYEETTPFQIKNRKHSPLFLFQWQASILPNQPLPSYETSTAS